MIHHEHEFINLIARLSLHKQDLLPSSLVHRPNPNSIAAQKLAQLKKDTVSHSMKYLLLSALLQFFQNVAASQGSLVLVSGYNSALNIFNITGDKSAI